MTALLGLNSYKIKALVPCCWECWQPASPVRRSPWLEEGKKIQFSWFNWGPLCSITPAPKLIQDRLRHPATALQPKPVPAPCPHMVSPRAFTHTLPADLLGDSATWGVQAGIRVTIPTSQRRKQRLSQIASLTSSSLHSTETQISIFKLLIEKEKIPFQTKTWKWEKYMRKGKKKETEQLI